MIKNFMDLIFAIIQLRKNKVLAKITSYTVFLIFTLISCAVQIAPGRPELSCFFLSPKTAPCLD